MGDFDFMADFGNVIGAPAVEGLQQVGIRLARETQEKQYGINKGYYQPYYDAGTGALGDLTNNLHNGAYNVNLTPQNLQGDPGYQFQLAQGQKALERSAASQGGLNSGGFMKAMDQYSQGLASTQYQNAWNRQFQQNQFNYNSLANMAGMGQSAAGSLAALGERHGNTMADSDRAKWDATANRVMSQFNSAGRGASGLTSTGVKYGSMAAVGGMGGGMGGVAQAGSTFGGGGGQGQGGMPGGGYGGGGGGYGGYIPMQQEGAGYGYSPNSGIPWSGDPTPGGSIGYAPLSAGGAGGGGYGGMPSMQGYGYDDGLGGYGNGGAYSLIPPQGGGY